MKDYTKDLTFWQRLESFVRNVETGDFAGEEEKEMIIYTCEMKIAEMEASKAKIKKDAKKYFKKELSGEPLYQDMVIDWLVDFAEKQLKKGE